MTEARTRTRIVSGAALAAVGGLGLVAAFPPVGAWPLIFVAFVPIALAQHRILPAAWAGLAPVVGIGTYVAYLGWGGLEAGQRPWLLLLVPVLAGSGWTEARWQRATVFRHLWWSSPVTWTAALHAVGLTPFASWLDPAYALYGQPWLIQPVSVVALSGLNLLIMLTNYAVVAVILSPVRRTRAVLTGGIVTVLALWITGSAVLLSAGRDGPSVRVAAVQIGLRTNQAVTPISAARSNAAVLPVLESGTRAAASQGARVVVWPEKALAYVDPRRDQARTLQRLAASTGVYLVVGYTPDPDRLNQATVIDPVGRLLAVYDKQHPVTFAGDHSVGGHVVIASTTLGRIATIICYDLDFEDTARAAARNGAQLLAVPSEDWSGIADQHYTHLVFRAVENGLAAVKADTAWDSAIIDPEGRIVASRVSTSATGAVLVADVRVGTGRTPFVTVGNVVGKLCIALVLLWIGLGVRGTRSGSRQSPMRSDSETTMPSGPRT